METLIRALCDLDETDVVLLAATVIVLSAVLLWAGILGGAI